MRAMRRLCMILLAVVALAGEARGQMSPPAQYPAPGPGPRGLNFVNDALLDAGSWTPQPYPNDEYHMLQIGGTLAGDDGKLMGAVFDLVNASPTGVGHTGEDTSHVRAVIGTVTTTGPGSVRFLHGHAIGASGSTGTVNAVNAQVTCPIGNPNCRAIEVASTGEAAAQGIVFGTSGLGHFDYLIHAYWPRVDLGFVLLPTGTPGGRITWFGGGMIESPSPGVVRIDGILQNATIAALEARIRKLEQTISAPPSPPVVPPQQPPEQPPVSPPADPPPTPPTCQFFWLGVCLVP
jgi:hypothetical protein